MYHSERMKVKMKKHFIIYTAKNGERYIQTSNKYLAHGLVFCGFEFKRFTKNESVTYSFQYSEEIINVIETISNLRHEINE